MSLTVGIHPGKYETKLFGDAPEAFARISAYEGDGRVAIFLPDTDACDELIKAAVLAKSLLLGETSPPVPTLAGTRDWPSAPWDDEPAPATEVRRAHCRSCGHVILERTDGRGWVHDSGLFAGLCTDGSPQPAPAAEVPASALAAHPLDGAQ